MSQKARKRYWKSLKERAGAGARESREAEVDVAMSRRSFLKAVGFSLSAATLSACSRSRVFKAAPHLVASEGVVPGRAAWYASTCGGCSAGCGALVKVRDGRPIKLEGSPAHPISRGGLCAVGQASILELYDSRRLKSALWGGNPASWSDVDARILAALKGVKTRGSSVRVLTGTVTSPSLEHAIARFLAGFSDGKHVVYDALSTSAILEAHSRTHGERSLPRYRFEEADVIVGIDADFLGTWISPVEYSAGWRSGRTLEGTPPRMSYHVQYEARMSLTGANADRRVLLAPGFEALLAEHLANEVAARAGAPAPFGASAPCPVDARQLKDLAGRLWASRGRSFVVCGTNNLAAQLAVNQVNHLLGSYRRTLDLQKPSFQRRGDDSTLRKLFDEISGGKVGALVIHGCNPAAELPAAGASWQEALGRVGLVVATSSHLDETSRLAAAVVPDHHYLESWADAQPAAGVAAVVQPVLRPLGDTRSALESFALWTGKPQSALDMVRGTWRASMHARQSSEASFDDFWNRTVQDGFAALAVGGRAVRPFDGGAVRSASRASAGPPGTGLALVLYPKVGMLEGRHAQNPWLQEMPDPVSKVVWDNYASLSPETARSLGVEQGDLVRLSTDAESLELPAFLQPGQKDGTVCAALGYGRDGTERFFDVGPDWISGKPTVPHGGRVGRNVSRFLSFVDGQLSCTTWSVRLEKTGGTQALACTQDYHSLKVPERLAEHPGETRDIVRETTLAEYAADASSGNPSEPSALATLWPTSSGKTGRRWGMTVDLSACTGCSSCVIACQAENNIPVVGKDEVARRRDMHWMRIDRYYADIEAGIEAVHQPMLCQQCGHASCETVCPVAATVGGEEGLNQQVYNRCVGTRYCANNCPYKVRRFNWFEYRRADAQENMVLNPDVTIRSRGVMEKCSFCIQRIQEAKIEAKRLGVPLGTEDILTACQQSCPTQAIVFGDLNDAKSRVAARMKDPRRYRVLEEIGVEPAIGYLTKVSNRRV
ncbi:MAG TPA: hypothetical protein DCZ01_01765 [Elusimicrobia bacterium]|nr:MAG: hypothetical protein A2X37_07415 [Elusimicrobia bacterium GWA2_66_18]HAZ07257.1 hypothetical protein [Elusimicrobiota bacterium]